MPRDSKLYLKDIIEAAQFIEVHTDKLSYEQFVADDVLLRAVLHSLTIIGEAAKHVPDEVRQQDLKIPWREITGARDIIVHGYFSVHLPIIWNIVNEEISELRQQVEKLLESLG